MLSLRVHAHSEVGRVRKNNQDAGYASPTLLLVADVLSRALIAPEELPVGVVTAVLGGVYLFWLLRQRSSL